MPARLRPKAPLAADVILVGDPGRSLLLAQELLEAPRMSNHARGLWGYSGSTTTGHELTIQATGMGGPSAAAVLDDLAELGVQRAIRIGTCTALDERAALGELLVVGEAIAGGGSAASFGLALGDRVPPDGRLSAALAEELGGDGRTVEVASFDSPPVTLDTAVAAVGPAGAVAADMQTVAVLARAKELGIAAAAALIVSEASEARVLDDDALEDAAKRAGRAASSVLST